MPNLARASWCCAVLACTAPALAQLPLNFNRSFADTFAGGTGNIGVTQDEVTFDFYVCAFQNAQTVHRFDLLGTPLTAFTSVVCSPPATTPNDITYDPVSGDLFLVDNDQGGLVVRMNRLGTCLGGWHLPLVLTNPIGICVDRSAGTLFIAHAGAVIECDFAGNLLGGGFTFVPPSGASLLSGITYIPAVDHFLLTRAGGNDVYEVDRSGALLSTTSLSSFGIANTQGLHYNPVLQQLAVVDNSLSTVFVFDLPSCSGSIVSHGVACTDGGGQTVLLGANGCPDVGTTPTLRAMASPNPVPMLFVGGASATLIGGLPLPLALAQIGGPSGCWLYTSSEAITAVPSIGGIATMPFAIPNNGSLVGAMVFLQAIEFDLLLTVPLPFSTSNYLAITVG